MASPKQLKMLELLDLEGAKRTRELLETGHLVKLLKAASGPATQRSLEPDSQEAMEDAMANAERMERAGRTWRALQAEERNQVFQAMKAAGDELGGEMLVLELDTMLNLESLPTETT